MFDPEAWDAARAAAEARKSLVASFTEISREEAGLSEWAEIASEGVQLNPRLKKLLASPSSYGPADFQSGILRQGNVFLLDDEFKVEIGQAIRIGTNRAEVQERLGTPTCRGEDTLFYKTDSFYLGFKGSERVEKVLLAPKPQVRFPPQFLARLFTALSEKRNLHLEEFMQQHPEWRELFPAQSHIHGGGWHSSSPSGIAILELNDNTIEVNNNFPGEIVKSYGGVYEIRFSDKDAVVEEMAQVLRDYEQLNVLFREEGKYSPSRKRIAVHERHNSDVHYFTIRSVDRTTPDFRIDVDIHDYVWLTDNYILVLDFPRLNPFVVKVAPQAGETELIDVLSRIGVSSEVTGEYELGPVTSGRFTIKREGETWSFRFSEANDGTLSVSGASRRPDKSPSPVPPGRAL